MEEHEKERRFWRWFKTNKKEIERFLDSDLSDYKMYEELTEKLQNYNKLLYPELTKSETNKYLLILTPDGNKRGINAVKKLYEMRPELENWIVLKYRQPTNFIQLNFNGLEYSSNDIEILPDFGDDEVDLDLYVKNLNTDIDRYKNLAFLYLDHILGEYNSMMKVRYIDFHHLNEEESIKNSISLLELRKQIEERLY